MFSYFGSKSKIVHLYSPPVYDTVIEPFAGSARYASRYFEKDVWINDAYEVIVEIWKWIQQASRDDIRRLPELKQGDRLDQIEWLSPAERALLGFAITQGAASPHMTASGWSPEKNSTRSMKANLLNLCGRIGHWRITHGSYSDMDFGDATWYIDPPYQQMGHRYKHSEIDYTHLADWCKSRSGQVIVCEGTGADWLPFKVLRSQQRIKRKDAYHELIWSKCDRKIGFGLN